MVFGCLIVGGFAIYEIVVIICGAIRKHKELQKEKINNAVAALVSKSKQPTTEEVEMIQKEYKVSKRVLDEALQEQIKENKIKEILSKVVKKNGDIDQKKMIELCLNYNVDVEEVKEAYAKM